MVSPYFHMLMGDALPVAYQVERVLPWLGEGNVLQRDREAEDSDGILSEIYLARVERYERTLRAPVQKSQLDRHLMFSAAVGQQSVENHPVADARERFPRPADDSMDKIPQRTTPTTFLHDKFVARHQITNHRNLDRHSKPPCIL
jgi:hypothetical protein